MAEQHFDGWYLPFHSQTVEEIHRQETRSTPRAGKPNAQDHHRVGRHSGYEVREGVDGGRYEIFRQSASFTTCFCLFGDEDMMA